MLNWIRRLKRWNLYRKYNFLLEVYINNHRINTRHLTLLEMHNFNKEGIISFKETDKCEIWVTNLQNFEKELLYKYENGETTIKKFIEEHIEYKPNKETIL